MLNKVPEVTVFFWVIKVLCTTVGESFADYVNETLGFGLTNTTLVFSAALVIALVVQFRRNRYVPAVYWLAVVLISVVGALLTDNGGDPSGGRARWCRRRCGDEDCPPSRRTHKQVHLNHTTRISPLQVAMQSVNDRRHAEHRPAQKSP